MSMMAKECHSVFGSPSCLSYVISCFSPSIAVLVGNDSATNKQHRYRRVIKSTELDKQYDLGNVFLTSDELTHAVAYFGGTTKYSDELYLPLIIDRKVSCSIYKKTKTNRIV
jgi:hypothetical protein